MGARGGGGRGWENKTRLSNVDYFVLGLRREGRKRKGGGNKQKGRRSNTLSYRLDLRPLRHLISKGSIRKNRGEQGQKAREEA